MDTLASSFWHSPVEGLLYGSLCAPVASRLAVASERKASEICICNVGASAIGATRCAGAARALALPTKAKRRTR